MVRRKSKTRSGGDSVRNGRDDKRVEKFVHFAASSERQDNDSGPSARAVKRAEKRGGTGMWRRGDGVCAKRQYSGSRQRQEDVASPCSVGAIGDNVGGFVPAAEAPHDDRTPFETAGQWYGAEVSPRSNHRHTQVSALTAPSGPKGGLVPTQV